MDGREIRVPVTGLKKYLNEVGITVTALANVSGINRLHLSKCLNGTVDERTGAVRTMSSDTMGRLQEALHELAVELKYIFIYYNADQEVVKRNGSRYCPGCVEQIKEQLSPYVNVVPFMQYALGWSRSKVANIMNCKGGIAYGNISQDDCNRINITLAEIATRLDALTLTRGWPPFSPYI